MLSDSSPKQVQLSERERISLIQSNSVAGGNGICSCAALKVMLHKAIDQYSVSMLQHQMQGKQKHPLVVTKLCSRVSAMGQGESLCP